MSLTLNEVRFALGLETLETDVELVGVSTDTRTIRPGMLFVALQGENYNGHDYVGRAFEHGAAAAIASVEREPLDRRLLIVPDTLFAYGKIAAAWRRKFDIPVIAVTGSVGKTTMKEMIALALGTSGPILKSENNENNEVGVPQTLLRLNDSHRAAVIEMGMRGFGQIKYLAEIATPTIAVITVIGESHIEMVGSRDGIADAKAELIESLDPSGIAVLNRDDPYFARLSSKTQAEIVSFGTAAAATVRIVDEARSANGWSFGVVVDGERYLLAIHSPARHDVYNAAGALVVARAAGVSVRDAIAGLDNYRPSHMRMEALTTKTGATVLSDCYNAAPSSVKSALQTLANFRDKGKTSAFLGDMRELGEYSGQMHADVADEAALLKITHVYPIGNLMRAAFNGSDVQFATAEDAATFVRESLLLTEEDIVLVKGSRALQLEKVVEALVAR
jgi:UDP-N-acetylmuramoyl-tripeptide--D-alanyl-D-alanine ligase